MAVILIAILLAGWAVGGRSAPAEHSLAAPHPVFLSASSCSAAACHGGNQLGRTGSEYTAWAPELGASGPRDPHSHAYRALFNDDSMRIAKLLGGGPAHENALCLKCHAPAGLANPAARAEGVGCTACHGGGDAWLAEHYLPTWKAKGNREKASTGFVPTKNLATRVAACAGCHVGSSDGEVNHNLIAAGHPRLAFEAARFHFQPNYRKHWVEPRATELGLWAIGQAVSARAAVQLLQSRAERASRNAAPWPEFAGYGCYACHQSLSADQPRPGGKPRPQWEPWYTATLDRAASHSATLLAMDKPDLRALSELKTLMAGPNPSSQVVTKHASAALKELDGWLTRMQAAEDRTSFAGASEEQAAKLIRDLTQDALIASNRDWDCQAMRYLGCAASYHAAGGATTRPDWSEPIHDLHRMIGSPASFKRLAPNRLDRALRQLHDAAGAHR
ncbi:MAG TPA: multiheme c-type cytochrome [Urbifossiella sp.]|nr:multiheme c-type cytochrome [Urbifossiella sp.]